MLQWEPPSSPTPLWGTGALPPQERAAGGRRTSPHTRGFDHVLQIYVLRVFNGVRCQICSAARKHHFLLVSREQQVISSPVPALYLQQGGRTAPSQGGSTFLSLPGWPWQTFPLHWDSSTPAQPFPLYISMGICFSRAASHHDPASHSTGSWSQAFGPPTTDFS